jgi:hypothetical protein
MIFTKVYCDQKERRKKTLSDFSHKNLEIITNNLAYTRRKKCRILKIKHGTKRKIHK